MSQFDDTQSRSSGNGDVTLSPADQRIVDALVEARFDRTRLPHVLGHPLASSDEERAASAMRLMGYMDDYPVDDAEPALIHAALARIDRYEDQQSQRLRFDVAQEEHARRGFRIRMPDFITVAAVVLIGVGVLWPVVGSIRQQSMDANCANNLKHVGYAFNQYASDYNGSPPLAMAGPSGTWDTVSNMLNLKPLVQGKYCEDSHLECPGHHHNHAELASAGVDEGPSYSYRWFTPQGAMHWNTGRITVILGDLNPLIEAAHSGWDAPPLSVSANHGGRGQNVLASDGATIWLAQPLIGGTAGVADNIWIPNNADMLRRGAVPTDDMDVFLVH